MRSRSLGSRQCLYHPLHHVRIEYEHVVGQVMGGMLPLVTRRGPSRCGRIAVPPLTDGDFGVRLSCLVEVGALQTAQKEGNVAARGLEERTMR